MHLVERKKSILAQLILEDLVIISSTFEALAATFWHCIFSLTSRQDTIVPTGATSISCSVIKFFDFRIASSCPCCWCWSILHNWRQHSPKWPQCFKWWEERHAWSWSPQPAACRHPTSYRVRLADPEGATVLWDPTSAIVVLSWLAARSSPVCSVCTSLCLI